MSAQKGKVKITHKKRIKVSENQLSMISSEKQRIKQERTQFSWTKMSEILNAEGPAVKSDVAWKSVYNHK